MMMSSGVSVRSRWPWSSRAASGNDNTGINPGWFGTVPGPGPFNTPDDIASKWLTLTFLGDIPLTIRATQRASAVRVAGFNWYIPEVVVDRQPTFMPNVLYGDWTRWISIAIEPGQYVMLAHTGIPAGQTVLYRAEFQ